MRSSLMVSVLRVRILQTGLIFDVREYDQCVGSECSCGPRPGMY